MSSAECDYCGDSPAHKSEHYGDVICDECERECGDE